MCRLILLGLIGFAAADLVQVQVEQGKLAGEVLRSFKNNAYTSYKGIPYAAPPVGKLRFKAPKPPLSWDGVRNATAHGSVCPQINILNNERIPGSEDCLFLNVYTPDINCSSLLPVMVYIHGGSFKTGSGNEDQYGPNLLMDYGVVLVTINYRLETLGFLSLQNEDVPGNAGMKDQVAALRWIKQNIKQFGGDPDKVTLFGQSAGSAAVAYHMMSPMSKGLFQRAILMSGVPFCDFTYTLEPRETAMLLGKQLGFFTEDTKALLDFLQNNVTSDQLYDTKPSIVAVQNRTENILKLYYFMPVVEQNCGNECFLSADTEEIIKSGKIHEVDAMFGYIDKEALVVADKMEDSFMPQYELYPEMLVPTKINLYFPPNTTLKVSKMIRNQFFGSKTINIDVADEFITYLSESSFVYDINRFFKVLPNPGNNTRYKYRFSMLSGRNVYGNTGAKFGIKGAGHFDDTFYLFDPLSLNLTLDPNSEDYKLVDEVCTLWTNFAKYGNPTPDDSLGMTWPQYDSETEAYLEIGNTLETGTKIDENSTAFWKSVFDYVGLDYYPSKY